MSALVAWMDTVEATIEAVTPNATHGDTTATPYHFIDSLDTERGDGQHRQLIWQGGTWTGEVISQFEEQQRWSIQLELFILKSPNRIERTISQLMRACVTEANDIILAHNAVTALGAGGAVHRSKIDRVTIETREPVRAPPPQSGGVKRSMVRVITFFFSVEVGAVAGD